MIPLALILVLCVCPPVPAAGHVQEAEQIEGNPFEGDPDAIEQGMSRYRARCALCHGMDAKGYRAPDLTSGQSRHGDSDVQLFRVIRRGVPGTEMQPTRRMPDDELWTVIAYLRTLRGSAEADLDRGNAQNGENLYWGSANC
jgi:mono/diheme cytochrome c family protein